MTKFSRAIRNVGLAATAAAVLTGQAGAQAVSDARVKELLGQAQVQVQKATEAATPQAATTRGPRVNLTMDEAVAKALQLNIDLSVSRLNPQLQDMTIAQAAGAYAPTLTSTISELSSTTVPNNVFGGGDKVTQKTFTYNFGGSQAVKKTGGTFSVSFNNNRADSTSTASQINPSYGASLRATFVQPLLRNREIDTNRQALLAAEITRRLADVSLRATTINTVANTRNAYWDFVYAVQAVDAAQQSLSLANKLVDDNKVRVEIGTLAPIDVVSAQSQAATQRQALVTAQANVQTAELVLKRLIVSGTDDSIWTSSLNPTDRPAVEVAEKIDVEAALRKALENRTDLVTARENLKSSDVTLKYQKNQLLPQVDLTAYYQTAGTGGTYVKQTPIVEVGLWDTYTQLWKRDQPTWNLSVGVSYPLGMSTQKANYARTRIAYQQSLAQLKSLELTVATDLTNQAMTVTNNFEQVQAARAARELSQKQLEAVQSKFDVGMATNYDVVLAQRDFTNAQNSELRAILNYRKSLVDFERKQQAPTSGS